MIHWRVLQHFCGPDQLHGFRENMGRDIHAELWMEDGAAFVPTPGRHYSHTYSGYNLIRILLLARVCWSVYVVFLARSRYRRELLTGRNPLMRATQRGTFTLQSRQVTVHKQALVACDVWVS